jgi:hypothetical protein
MHAAGEGLPLDKGGIDNAGGGDVAGASGARQYLYLCTSKASKLSIDNAGGGAVAGASEAQLNLLDLLVQRYKY